MATKAAQSKSNIKPSWAAIAGSIASLWLAYKHYPAFAGIWASWYGAAWLAQPANLTGKDPMTGNPIPRGPAELKQSNRHTIWRTMRLTMLPHPTWMPPTRLPLIWSLIAAAAATAAPVEQSWMRAVNAALAICTINGTFAARRRGAAENDEAPGAKLADLTKAPKPAIIVGVAVAAIGGVAATLFTTPARTSIITAAIAGAAPGLLIWTGAATKAAHRDWWHLVKRRREVAPYWELAKMKPGPTLTATANVGPAIIDTYHLAGGANTIMLSPAKIDGFLPPGMRYAVLDVPNEGPNGPVAGTIHPHMFQVVAWPVDGVPDISDPDLDPDVAKLALRSAVDWGWIRNGSTWSAWGDAEIVTTEGSPVVWRVTLATDMWTMYPGDVYGPSIGQMSLVDTETEVGGCYIGAPFENTEFIERQYGNLPAPQYFEAVTDMNEWAAAWKAVLKQGAFAPRYYPETKKEVPFVTAGGRQGILKHAVFATNEGDGFIKFVGCEEKLRTALERGSAPFVARLGYTAANEPAGSRHTSLFRIVWSAKAGPASISDLSPKSDTNAIRWIIGGMLNQAFDASRYPRPEVAGTPRCLTPKDADEHLWAVPLRLHDGFTVAEVRAKERNIQAALRVTYMRIIEGETRDQVTLYIGCDHRNRPLERERDRPTLEALDWSKAMLEAKVLGSNGTAPTLVSIEPLPNNPQVQRIQFALPPPLDLPTVREAVEKLKTASRNAFIQVSGSSTPGQIEVLASFEDPMPRMAPFDFEAVANAKHVPFATSVEGETVEFDPTESPHLLILGPTGTGKAQPLDTPIPVPLSPKFPTGIAPLGDLVVGDLVFAADGSIVPIVGLSTIRDEDEWEVEFDDGRTVRAAGTHLWTASDANQRAARSTHGVHRTEWSAEADSIRGIAAEMPSNAVASLEDIAAMTNRGIATLLLLPSIRELAIETLAPKGRKSALYSVDELVAAMSSTGRSDGWVAQNPNLASLTSAGNWLTVGAIADHLAGRRSTRQQRELVKGVLRTHAVARGPLVQATRTVNMYPVAEVLGMLADRLDRGRRSGIKPHTQIVSTESIAESLTRPSGSGHNWSIQNGSGINTPALDLQLDPYVLGAWLGDGSSKDGVIASSTAEGSCTDADGVTDQEWMLGRLALAGIEASPAPHAPDRTLLTRGLRPLLKKLGLINNKHIPAQYLRGSDAQRLALLQGLMDTDGYVSESGQCELALSDLRLASDALHLIRSLGIKASVTANSAGYRDSDGVYVSCKDRHRIKFTTTRDVCLLPRKAARVATATRSTQDHAYIVACRKVGRTPMRCINIDHPDHLYLTNDFVPTHNSVDIQALMFGFLVRGSRMYVADAVKGCADFKFAEDRCLAMATNVFAAALMMKAVYAEVVRRKNLNSAAGVGSVFDLPEPPPRLVIVIDEFTSLMAPEQVPPKTDDPELALEREAIIRINIAKGTIGAMTGKIAREARSAGASLILGTQKLRQDDLNKMPGASDLKDLTLDTRLPVPISDRFPSGWARNDELEVGDLLYTPYGTTSPILGFSELIEGNDVYAVTFDDGQVIKAGAGHLWLASDSTGRKHAQRHAAAVANPNETAVRAKIAAEMAATVGDDSTATSSDLARMLGYSSVTSIQMWGNTLNVPRYFKNRNTGVLEPFQLGLSRGKAGHMFNVSEASEILSAAGFASAIESLTPGAGEWWTATEIVRALSSETARRPHAGRIAVLLNKRGCQSKAQGRDAFVYKTVEYLKAYSAQMASDAAPVTGERVVTTFEMAQQISRTRDHSSNWAIRLAEPFDGPDIELPVDPYVLGAWLGDGSSGSGLITAGDAPACTDADGITDQQHMITQLAAAGYNPHPLACNPILLGTNGLKAKLREAGVLHDKHIPATYLRASAKQRLALLQGLMDTDGSLSASGQCSLPQVKRRLAIDAQELARSLGIKCHWSEWDARYTRDGDTESTITGRVHNLSFRTTLPVFRLPRKLAKQANVRTASSSQVRYIRSIERIPTEPTRCIGVADDRHLFLAEGFIPTHNTNLARLLLGKATTGDKQSALRDPFEAPAVGEAPPKGRGLFEPLSSSCIVIQTWYSPQSKLREMLVEMVPAVDPADQLVLPDEDPFLTQLTGDPDSVWASDEPVPGLWGNPWPDDPTTDDRASGGDSGWSEAEVWPAMLWPDGYAADEGDGPSVDVMAGDGDDDFWDIPSIDDAGAEVWADPAGWDDSDDIDGGIATVPASFFPPPVAAPAVASWAPPTPALPPPTATHTRDI